MTSSSSLTSELAFIDDSEDEDMLLACVLVGEYLEETQERPKFYVRHRMAWEKHISVLAAEGNDAFQ